jgi:hypothetical protein
MSQSFWFDVNNVEHLAAYKHLCENGEWPDEFKATANYLSVSAIQSRMAQKWVKYAMAGTIPGIPPHDPK